MSKKEKVRKMFDNISKDYDKLNHIMSLDADKIWRRRAIKRIVDTEIPLKVLDVACGTGDFSIEIAKAMVAKRGCPYCSFSPKVKAEYGQVTGVDISEGMLGVMKKKVAGERLEKLIEIRIGDGENLNFADNVFDRITIAFGIRNFENMEKGLREMLRVLKPEGRLVVLELSLPENKFMRWLFNLYFLHILPFIGGSVSGDSAAYKYLPESVLSFPKRKEFIKLMSASGFSKISHKAFSFGICRMYIGEK